MKITYFMTYVVSFIFIVGETSRRGLQYFSVNATTMFEDYVSAALLLIAAALWAKNHAKAPAFMIAAWGYATGGMFVPFFAHLEAYVREITFRADHPHEDLNSVILKAVVWLVCVVCFIVSIRHSGKLSENHLGN